MSKRRDHYMGRINAAAGRRRLNEAVDYLRAATAIDRAEDVAAELVVIADREGDRK